MAAAPWNRRPWIKLSHENLGGIDCAWEGGVLVPLAPTTFHSHLAPGYSGLWDPTSEPQELPPYQVVRTWRCQQAHKGMSPRD